MPIILTPLSPTPTPGPYSYPTLGDYRRRLAEAAGFHVLTQTSGTSPQNNQVVVVDFQSTELEPTFLLNTWMYQPSGPNAGSVRRVVGAGVQTGTGVVTLERALPAITPSATPIEFMGRLPPVRYEGRLGLNEIVNKVLAECWTIQKLQIPGVQDQRVYPLGTLYPWLQSEDQIVDVYYLGATTDPNAQDQLMVSWRWVPGGNSPAIEIGTTLNNGDILKPQVFVPMSWWVSDGTTWGFPNVEGLHADTDQALLPLVGMETVGQPYINLEMSKWGLPDDQTRFMTLRAQARAAANQWKRLSLMHPDVRKQHWPSVLTIRSRDNMGYGYTVLMPG